MFEYQRNSFFRHSWCQFDYDERIAKWVSAALPEAQTCVSDPANAHWFRSGDTWFVGVNILPNDSAATVKGAALEGEVIDFIRQFLCVDRFEWDRGQISVCYPGYPRPMPNEPEKAFKYRVNKNAAHVDGLLREGPDMRRHLREHHGFILGLPLVDYSHDASPLVVWEGSHHIVKEVFTEQFKGLAPADWGDIDVTEMYLDLRYRVFSECQPVEISAKPGEAYLLHRLAVHGMSPWREGASAGSDGRMICYFRPEYGGPRQWLDDE